MNYSLFIANRLSLGNRRGNFSPAVTVAIIAIAISIAVMISAIAIVMGFKKEIHEKVVGFNGHISLYKIPSSEEDSNLITVTPYLENLFSELPFITEYNEVASIPAILKTQDDFKGVYLRGLKGFYNTEYLKKNIEEGEVPDYSNEENNNKIVISRKAANQLKLKIGDKIDTYFISEDIKARKLEITGIYNSHFEQYDDVLIFGSMGLVAKLGNLPEDTGTYIIIQTTDFDKIPEYTNLLQMKINRGVATGETEYFYRTDNVYNQGRGFFGWLSLLDTNVIVIIILMMTVGCITLISGMLIIILERKKFIGLMRALGAPTNKIQQVFIIMALRIAIIGLSIGNIAIILLLYFQRKYHILQLDPDSYYIDYVPVDLTWWIIVCLNVGVIFVTYLILVLPSKFVGKISPAESMIKSE